MKTLLWVLFFTAYDLSSFASPADTIHVKIKDDHNNPVKGIKINVHHYPAFYSDAKGSYELKVKEELEMPFEVLTDSKDYEISKFNYYKDADELVIKVKNKIGTAVAAHSAVHHNIIITPHNTEYISALKQKEKITNDGAVGSLPLREPVQVTMDSAKGSDTYSQYKGDFEKITHEIYLERERLVENNDHIKDEISKITLRLDKEKNLTAAERAQLKAYLRKLELEFEQNAEAFRKAEAQTKVLIDKLRLMLLEKDSINAITATKLKIEQEKRFVAERKNTRSFTIFSIITFFLLLLAISFYSIARKMRKQRTNLLLSNHELNEQKKLIEEQNKQLDIFAYRASHDIKGPLKSITALSAMAADMVTDKSSLELLSLIHKSSVKLDKMVTEMLLLAKDSKSEPNISTVNVSQVVNEILQELKKIEGYDKVAIDVHLSPQLSIATDRTLFQSVVQNLIENAIKYSDKTKEKQTLHISTQETKEGVSFSFKDNGVGIAEQFHEKVFISFFRNSYDSNGTGLGLYIVKQNITKLGGTITLESQPDKGSTFTVHLPLS